jgi:hypothetical protein
MLLSDLYLTTAIRFEDATYNWQQEEYGMAGNCHCINGGMAHTLGDGYRVSPNLNRVEHVSVQRPLCDIIGIPVTEPVPGVVITWNDKPGRTQEEVVDLLRAASRAVIGTGRDINVAPFI